MRTGFENMLHGPAVVLVKLTSIRDGNHFQQEMRHDERWFAYDTTYYNRRGNSKNKITQVHKSVVSGQYPKRECTIFEQMRTYEEQSCNSGYNASVSACDIAPVTNSFWCFRSFSYLDTNARWVEIMLDASSASILTEMAAVIDIFCNTAEIIGYSNSKNKVVLVS